MVCCISYAQDTIKIESPTLQERSRNRSYWKTSKELIYFSKNHVKIEDCYYYNNKRDCSGIEYQIKQDTLIIQQKEKWVYKKLGVNNYEVIKLGGTHFEVGHASSLIPLTKTGPYYGLSLANDTLWEENFINNSSKNFNLYKTLITSEIHNLKKLDSIPLINGSDSIPKIILEFVDLRPNANFHIPFNRFDSVEVNFIITNKGKIKNIEISPLIYSPYLKEIAIKTSLFKKISIPTINNNKVFCKYQMKAYKARY